MKLPLPDHLNGSVLLRHCGYAQIHDRHSGHDSFVRRLGTYHYPRFHVYVEGGSINLHLDQKQASYKGTSAHAGEYDGPAVETEIRRIESIINQVGQQPSPTNTPSEKSGGWGSKFF
jgi:hypothetical protein